MTETTKLYYSISEVSERLGVKPHVLRYWETQFRWLRPKKNRAGNRSYQEKDLVLLEQIRELLYARRFTIEGARQELDRRRSQGGAAPDAGLDLPESGGPAAESEAGAAESAESGPRELAEERERSSSSRPPAGAVDPVAAAPVPAPPAAAAADRGVSRREWKALRDEIAGLKDWLERAP